MIDITDGRSFRLTMEDAWRSCDREMDHMRADDLLMDAIRRLTKELPDAADWEEGLRVFEQAEKWYR